MNVRSKPAMCGKSVMWIPFPWLSPHDPLSLAKALTGFGLIKCYRFWQQEVPRSGIDVFQNAWHFSAIRPLDTHHGHGLGTTDARHEQGIHG